MKSNVRVKYKLSEFITIGASGHPSKPLKISNYLSGKSFISRSNFLEIIDELRGELGYLESLKEILIKVFSISTEAANSIIESLLEYEILVHESCEKELQAFAERERWSTYGWEHAHYLHTATRDYPFLDYALPEGTKPDYELMQQYKLSSPMPSLYKEYADVPEVSLGIPGNDQETHSIDKIFSCREETQTTQNDLDITISDLSRILYYTIGEIASFDWRGQGRVLNKVPPSGGARHPTEGYLIVNKITGLVRGTYHYNVKEHALAQISKISSEENFIALVQSHFWDYLDRITFTPAFVIVLASRVERAQWRYRDPRSHRVIYIDGGHVLGALEMSLAAEDREYFITQGVKEDELEKLLNITSDEEVLLSAVFIK